MHAIVFAQFIPHLFKSAESEIATELDSRPRSRQPVRRFSALSAAPGTDGLCHISELSDGFVKNVSDVCKIGDTFEVKVIAVDDQNRVKLSRKAVLLASRQDAPADDDEE